MNVVGIDPSLCRTAIVVDGKAQMVTSQSRGSEIAERFERYTELARAIIEMIPKDDLVVYLEGYSYASGGKATLSLAEFGGVLRRELLEADVRIVEVPPTTLKKFATGKGNASKVGVATSLAKRYDVQFDTDDEYDAYGLYRIGLVAEGLNKPQTKSQAAVVAKLVAEACQSPH